MDERLSSTALGTCDFSKRTQMRADFKEFLKTTWTPLSCFSIRVQTAVYWTEVTTQGLHWHSSLNPLSGSSVHTGPIFLRGSHVCTVLELIQNVQVFFFFSFCCVYFLVALCGHVPGCQVFEWWEKPLFVLILTHSVRTFSLASFVTKSLFFGEEDLKKKKLVEFRCHTCRSSA